MLFIYTMKLLLCSVSICILTGVVAASTGYRFHSTLNHLKPKVSETTQKAAVEQLIQRILPEVASNFSISVNSSFVQDGKECFQVTKEGGKIAITATTGVVAATGFHYYLKYFCNAHISWEVSQLNLPSELPDVNIIVPLNDRFRYYQNVCTTSYSFVWWDWDQWEKHIDWMVLNSFNFVLAFNGQEAIWDRVYRKLGLTDADIEEHFSGPAFLSWLRMGNLRGWGGPLPQSWHDRSLDLQHKIVDRLRDFGVITILPGFAGQVPRAFERLYPNTTMTKMSDWNNFPDKYCCPYFIDPTDDLFHTIGKLFVEEQIAEYGTDHVYNCDSFNEMDPGTDNLTYLSNVGKSIFSGLQAADSDAIWLLQGWMFYNDQFWTNVARAESFLTSVPTGKIIVLDLQSEQFPQFYRLEQYFGQPYIWCMLHNFGGTLGMYGSAGVINSRVIVDREAENSTMIGTGLTMEGINQNYVIYDLMSEQAWRNQEANLTEWFRNYSRRRYGEEDENAEEAWQILQDTLYNFNGLERLRGEFVVTRTPNLNIDSWTWYNYSDVVSAWKTFIKAADSLGGNPGYLHDLVDLTRQVLQNNGNIYYKKLISAFDSKNVTEFQKLATIFRGIFLDLESILATNKAFLLGPWLESAKKCANSTAEEKLYEFNARNQITLWGPYGEIMNYAIKQWSGLVKDFLYPRWDEFVNAMNYSLVHNVTFNQPLELGIIFLLLEEPFVYSRQVYPTEPSGDAVQIAKAIASRNYYVNTEDIPKLKPIPFRKPKPRTKYRKSRRCVAEDNVKVVRRKKIRKSS